MENLSLETEISEQRVAVSVVLPFYNAHVYLKDAIESILSQDFDSLELILVDDGSTDRSLDIAKAFKEKDKRVRIITENNAGPAAARNKGLVRARGKYVVFLDADDFYEKTLISSLYDIAEKQSLDIAVCEFDLYNVKHARFEEKVKSDHCELLAARRVISKNEHPDYILQTTSGYVWNKMFRRDFIFENKLLFKPEIKVFEDVYFVTAAIATASRIAKVADVLIHHRIYSEQSRPKMFKKYFSEVPEVYGQIKKYLMQRGIYAPISVSFTNLSASRCYHVYNILWKDAKEVFWNLLHEGYAEELGWDATAPEEIEKPSIRSFVAAVSLYTYKQYSKKYKSVTFVEDAHTDQKFERRKALKRFCRIFRIGRK
jgi:glycosyltransferase involved in cell wall biosynthesis